MPRRYYRTASENDALYESMRAAIDAAWGLPSNGQQTAIEPAATAPHDAAGRIYLATWAEFATYEPAASMLAQAIASGAVEEVDAATYAAMLPPAT